MGLSSNTDNTKYIHCDFCLFPGKYLTSFIVELCLELGKDQKWSLFEFSPVS